MPESRPNILIIWGDDIGWFNVSAYNQGIMGYRTPNLYHLNAEEEPENPDYPKNPEYQQRFGPRGVLHSWATDVDDPAEDPVFGRVGKQRIENTGGLTTKRMETIDDEFSDAALDFIDRAHQAGKPFFVWWNSTRMHIFTHLKPESVGKTGLGTCPDDMVEHDLGVGRMLAHFGWPPAEFQASVKREPLIRAGAPLDYLSRAR